MQMEANWATGRLYRFSHWIMKLAYVNLLWILFSILGLGVLGVFPATIALFTVLRKWEMDEDIPIFQTFFQTYKNEFLKANVLGLVLSLVGYILYFNYIYITVIQGTIQLILSVVMLFAAILYFVIVLYLFQVYVHYDLKLFQYVRYSLFIGIANPIHTILMVALLALCAFFLYVVPGFLPFFFPSIFALVMMKVGLVSFEKIIEKREKLGM